MSEEINFDEVEFGEPIEEREPTYREGYIRGIYRARNIIDSKQKEIERLNKELEEANESIEWWSNRFNAVERDNERLNNIINELEKDIENKITFCSNESNGSVNNKLCKISIQYLEHLKNKLQELKGSNEPSFEEMVGFVENFCKDIKSQLTLHEELEEERKRIAKIVGDFKEVNK